MLGKLGDWTPPFGPYTPAQLVVLGGGAFVLIKTFDERLPLTAAHRAAATVHAAVE
ncbi:hypothetical protein ACFWJT_27900 [Streptomyces sp. NPDC127069]|uniref:hypothetical protein n=1 Tax=Streptomyces sp. NPDC127069 TaxID=3347128 RepID=UPI003669C8E7